jgi:GGDEF domain-containing protein
MIANDTLIILRQLTGQDIDQAQAQALFRTVTQITSDAPAPHAMVAGLMETLQLQDRLASDAQSDYIFTDILARDKHTGYYIHSALRTLYLDYALVRAAQTGIKQQPLLALGDFLNLSSVNEALGRNVTNDLMATICGIYRDAMTRHGVVNWLYHRSMGDEVTFIIMDCSQAQVEAGLTAAGAEVYEMVKALGIERLRHKKYPHQSGTGLITAVRPLTPDSDHRQLKQQIDEVIQELKKSGKTLLMNKLLGVEPEQFHNQASEQRVDKALHKYSHYRQLALQNMDPVTLEQRSALTPASALLTGRAIAWPRDDRIEYLRHHHDNSKMMLRADIYNLGGLNAVFGHDGADHIKAHYIRILYDAISAYDVEEPKVFDCGGGIIDVIFNEMAPAVLEKVVSSIQNQLYFGVLQHSVSSYAQQENLAFAGDGSVLLSVLPHPRYEVEGTGLIMAIHKVEKDRHLPEIIERLDKITHRTKMHGFAYLGHGVNGNVHALLLNQAAELLPIGQDRIIPPNSHYLPFTDALRDHIRPDDLPRIFERPIGQICEIIFGMDMQAVLGFKKALRMLQEKNIDDEQLEEITSYDAMDDLLKTHNLPPLSVVSTQNRPSLAVRERETFKTMSLAEKLEHLPKELATLLLQIQAIFYSLRLLRPHGQLPFAQAQQVLLEEMNTDLSIISGDREHDTVLTESLWFLTKLYDRSYACLQRPWPEKLQRNWQDLCLGCLHDDQLRLRTQNQTVLATLLELYLSTQNTPPATIRQEALQNAATYYTGLIDQMLAQEVIVPEQATVLEERFNSLFKRLHRALVQAAPDEKIDVLA